MKFNLISDNSSSIVESSIIMLKPGAIGEKYQAQLIQELSKRNLRVIAKRKVKLSRKQIAKLFHRNEPEYIEYLLTGNVMYYLVEGYMALEQTFELKQQLRELWGTKDNIRNYIHAVDEGVELALSLDMIFPSYSTPYRKGTMDQYWRCSNPLKAQKIMEEYRYENPYLSIIPCISGYSWKKYHRKWKEVLTYYKTPFFSVRFSRDSRYRFNFKPEVIRYFLTEYINDDQKLFKHSKLCLGYTAINNYDSISSALITAQKAGFSFCLAYHPEYPVKKVDVIEETAAEIGLLPIAGSGRYRPFTVAMNCFNSMNFEKRMLSI